MASSMIHIAIANEINKKIRRDNESLLIGTISPDISKLIGDDKVKSHFLDNSNTNIPNINLFLNKYKNYLKDDFVMGYYIHLMVDYLWFKYFVTDFWDENSITKLDGTKVKCYGRMILQYIYNDYTNMNIQLIDEYNLDLKIFYNDLPEFKNIIKEIPMNKLKLMVDKAGEIIENSKTRKNMVFDIKSVKKFITFSVEVILNELKEKNKKI